MLAYRFLFLITLPILFAASLLNAASQTVFANQTSENTKNIEECKIDIDLQGTLDKNKATVINYSKNQNCNYEATLAIYDVPQEPESPRWVDTQTLINSKTVNVKPSEKVEFYVEGVGLSCRIQADLFRGNFVLEPPFYSNAMDVKVYNVKGCGLIQSIKATPIPSKVSVTTVSEAPASAASENLPTNTPTPGPAAASTSQGGNVLSAKSEAGFAKTGDTSYIYSIIIAGAFATIFGFVLKRFSK